MLTKDLVQATVRSGKLFPKFIKASDDQVMADVDGVLEIFRTAAGRTVGDLEDELRDSAGSPRARAFAKLLMDRCEVRDPGDVALEERWKMFGLSERLRSGGAGTLPEFQRQLADAAGKDFGEIQSGLFSDLPAARSIDKIEDISAEALVDEYNFSHVALFLCMAESVSITFKDPTLARKREIMRQLKFQRLMADVSVSPEDKSLTLSISGALQLFGKAQVYGLKVANFFRFAASVPGWSLDAEVRWKGKKLRLEVDGKSGVRSEAKRSGGGYIPEEFDHLINALRKESDMSVEPGSDFVHIGRQSYCFPDLTVTTASGKYAIELFHPWHKHQLKSRIEAAAKAGVSDLIIGVERGLTRDPEIRALADSSEWFQRYGFEFTQFPTVSAVRKAVTRS